MEVFALRVSVPVASFRVPHAREYLETHPCPPPSTVYGMLLSLVGEPNRLRHAGAALALALVSRPARSVVLRTLWRVKDRKVGPGIGENRRPDFQELLTGVELALWVRPGADETRPTLRDRLVEALAHPQAVSRFGGLSLGESTHLVDEIRLGRDGELRQGQLLVQDPQGDLALPVWPDHVGSAGTRWAQYRLVDGALGEPLPEAAWTAITPPEAT